MGEPAIMCSHTDCHNRRAFYDIDGRLFCKNHPPVEMRPCVGIKCNGEVCGCRSRRSRNGTHTCLVHVPKSTQIECCSICLDDCPIGTKPTKCGHFFHRACMNTWREQANGNSCPMCRTELSKPAFPFPSDDILRRVTEIARDSVDAEAFMQNIVNTMSSGEIDVVLGLIRASS
jgi:hypothetical protein